MIQIPRLIKQQEQNQDRIQRQEKVAEQVHKQGSQDKNKKESITLTIEGKCVKKLSQGRQKIQEIKYMEGQCENVCKNIDSMSTEQIDTQLYINKDECKRKIKQKLRNFALNNILATPSKSLKAKQPEHAENIKQIRNSLKKYRQIHQKQVELFQNNIESQVKKIKQKIEYVKNRRQLRYKQLIIKAYLFEDKLSQLINEEQNRYQRSFTNALTLMHTLCDKFNINQQKLSQKLIQMQRQKRKDSQFVQVQQQVQKLYQSKILQLQLNKPLEISYQVILEEKQKPKYEISIQNDLQHSQDREQSQKEVN